MYILCSRAKHQGGTLLSLIHIMCKSLGTFALGEWILNFYFELWHLKTVFQMSLISGFQPSRVVWPYFIFSVFKTFFCDLPSNPVSCRWPGMGSDTCGTLDQSCASSHSRVSSWTCSGRFTLLWPLLPKGVAPICWGLWWIWKSSFGGLLSTEQHLFKVILFSF